MPLLLKELGQQPLADTCLWIARAVGSWDSIMTGSASHKAMAQDAVQLMQVTGSKGWVAGLSKALQPPSSRHQRMCRLSGTGFGAEMHLVLECAAVADLRGHFPDISQAHQTMQFMWQQICCRLPSS